MRSRYFITILVVLVAVIAGSLSLYSEFLQRERMSLIDQQVRETAAALVDSELGDLRKIEFETADEIISDELGETRIGKFFIIKNNQGVPIYESASAKLLPIGDIPSTKQWFEISDGERYIRGLNLKLPRINDRTLQVGLVIEEKLVRPNLFSKSNLLFTVVILAIGLIVSFFLTSFLLRPISLLDQYLSSDSVRSQSIVPAPPAILSAEPDLRSNDEFERVMAGLGSLIQRVNRNYQFSRLWGYQMAHELKTPLSLITLGLERLESKNQIEEKDLADIRTECFKIGETINSFLAWAELENSDRTRQLFAVDIGEAVTQLVHRFTNQGHKISLKVRSSSVIATSPSHLEQLIQNLLLNALKYSHENSEVEVEVAENELRIRDTGPGLPKEVADRLGEPFNRGAGNRAGGHGLGLAWANSICRRYGWSLRLDNTGSGLLVTVQFEIDPVLTS